MPELNENQRGALKALNAACKEQNADAVSEDLWRTAYAEAQFKLPELVRTGLVEEIRCAMGSRRPSFFRPKVAAI